MATSNDRAVVLFMVEDDPRTREELERILARHTDLSMRSFDAPSAALRALDGDARPDLALIDLRLPEMDGLTLLERMRDRAPDLLAIIMTGYGEASTARQARERGAVDFVEKPLDLPYLLVVLRQLEREARLRRDLRVSAGLFTKVMELMPDGILMGTASEQVLFANSLGRRLWDLGAREPGGQFRLDGRTYVLERTSSGDRILWHWTDLTQALDRERAAGYRQMARLLAHELRNPLTPMRLWLQELEATPVEDPRFRETGLEAVRVLLQQVNRLTELVQRFKTLGEEQPLQLHAVDVRRVVGEVLHALGPLAAQGGVALVEPAPEECWVMADDSALYHLLFNVVRNGIEAASAKGGRVAVALGAGKDEVVVTVEDDGGGLPPEVAAAPFTPYLTTKPGGTGLGLLVSRELAARLGTVFELLDSPGRGVEVRLVLPRAAGPAGEAPRTERDNRQP